MKLNNHGWGFRDMFFFMTILILFLLLVVFLVYRYYNKLVEDNKMPESGIKVNEINNNNNNIYSDLELKLKNAGRDFVKEYFANDIDEDELIITSEMLIEEKIMTNIYDLKDLSLCKGYVLARKVNNKSYYYPYLKCSNYVTDGYIEEYGEL